MTTGYITPYAGIVEAEYATDSSLQAMTSAVPGANYWSEESGTYYYDPSATVAESGDLTPSTLAGIFKAAPIQLVKVGDSGVISGFNVQLSPGDIALTNGDIFVGNANNVAAGVALSGDATIDNTGVITVAANAITTTKINDADVTLAKLSAGITPSHVVKFGGRTTWSGGLDTLAVTVTGAQAVNQFAVATFEAAPSEAAYIASAAVSTNTLTFTLSAANVSDDCIITWVIYEAAA